MATVFKTLREYFSTRKEFVIPNYQRGYKWAVKLHEKSSAIEVLIDDLVKNFETEQTYFLQGVTVTENESCIELIDGQQRTTTLYLLLWYLEYSEFKNILLKYDIRESSGIFLCALRNQKFSEFEKQDAFCLNCTQCNQDIYYFKEGIRQIHKKLRWMDAKRRQDLCTYMLDKVSIIYIQVDRDKAVKTFTMMNGSKATMRKEELVKSEMLRLVSLPKISDRKVSSNIDDSLSDPRETIAKDWEINALRSRYAREWDKWMQWWNREEVVAYFGIEKNKNVIGLLLDFYFKKYRQSEKERFDDFASFRRLMDGNIKVVFKKLRDLQKSIEDLYNMPVAFNYLKLALICSHSLEDKLNVLQYFIDNKERKKQEEYALWRLVKATHDEIKKDNIEALKEKAQKVLMKLSDNFVYKGETKGDNEDAYRQLLYLNVNEYVKLGKKFNFNVWDNRSLEHIYPKSKVWHTEIVDEREVFKNGNNEPISYEDTIKEGMLERADFKGDGSEHCIGNLVLLYKNNNSTFNNADFKEKKQKYFNLTERDFFESRHLLHTISCFAVEQWGVKEIQNKKKEFIKDFKERYGINE